MSILQRGWLLRERHSRLFASDIRGGSAMTDVSTIHGAFRHDWERLGVVARRAGFSRGNQIIAVTRELRRRGIVECYMDADCLRWRLTRAQPAPADVVEAVKRVVRDCIKYDVPSDALDLRADEVAHAALSVIPVSGEVERLREALAALLDRYTRLVNSGDAGFWDPEEEDEVKLARQALNGAPDVGA
jgi:hypothetical protein